MVPHKGILCDPWSVSKERQEIQCTVTGEEDGQKLDRLVARYAGVSRRIARILISRGAVKANGRGVKILTKPMKAGVKLLIEKSLVEEAGQKKGKKIELHEADILYKDRWLVGIYKPSGLLSETDRLGSPSVQTLLPELLESQGESGEVHLVHRLDAGTSGVLVLARKPNIARAMHELFRQKKLKKIYLALSQGRLKKDHWCDAPIKRMPGQVARHGVHPEGKPSRTYLKELAFHDDNSLVLAQPKTGRTHQIRVHLAHLECPILGDKRYGGKAYIGEDYRPVHRPMLHAYALEFKHPKSSEPVCVEGPPRSDFKGLAESLGLWQNEFTLA